MTEAGNKSSGQAPSLDAVLRHETRRRRARIVIWSLLAVLVAAGVALWFVRTRPAAQPGPSYVTEDATIGTLVVRVSATGNLQPTNLVEIGSEVSGIVTEVLVDANDLVEREQILLQLDTTRLAAAVETSRASLQVAQAQVEQARAAAHEAHQTLSRLEDLHERSEGRVPAATSIDQATSAVQRADAAVAASRASVTQARALLGSDEANLEKATIRSPIDGVVLTRAVERGQTVAATFQAPVLFTIAEDLAQMELVVAIDEADVGRVRVGQRATFSVDAWPGRTYEGDVVRVGLGAQTVDGVVSYPALIAVNNDDLSLRPGMTATAEIVSTTREGALLVPNAALRFDPEFADAGTQASGSNFVGRLFQRPTAGATARTVRISEGRHVWILRDGEPVQIEVEPGETNGRVTEIAPGPIEPGTGVIVEMTRSRR